MKNVIIMFKEKNQIFYREVSKKGVTEVNSDTNKCWKKPVALKDYKKLEQLLDKDIAVDTKKKNTTKTTNNKTTDKNKKSTKKDTKKKVKKDKITKKTVLKTRKNKKK